MVRRSSRPVPASSPIQESDTLKGIKVLLIDDSGVSRFLFKTILESKGAEVFEAGTVEAGISAVRLAKPTVILSDIEMGRESGYAFIESLHALKADEGRDTPVAALTAHETGAELKKIREAGFRFCLAKNNFESMIEVVKQLAGEEPSSSKL